MSLIANLRASSGGTLLALLAIAMAGGVMTTPAAQAAVTISAGATQNMVCANGVCAPTAKNAELNAGDLENLLASGSATVTTNGTGVQANDIRVKAAFSWSSSSTLTLDAYRSIAINQTVSVTGPGGMTLLTDDGGTGGTLAFGTKGNVAFQNLSNQLAINGASYVLLNSIATLASAIAANPAGTYALASSYDATGDGVYAHSPIPTTFTGWLEGLGNVVSNLSIADTTEGDEVGFFTEIGTGGGVDNLGLTHVDIKGTKKSYVAGLVVINNGSLLGDSVSGRVSEGGSDVEGGCAAGGLVLVNSGTVNYSHTTGVVKGGDSAWAGGLAAYCGSGATIANSWSADRVITGAVRVGLPAAGGLIAVDLGSVSNSRASGAVSGGKEAEVGGLVGWIDGTDPITTSSATGTVTGGKESAVGGLVGLNEGSINGSYATGATASGIRGSAGGLVGLNEGLGIANSYATGAVSGAGGAQIGGLAGYDFEASMEDSYATGKMATGEFIGGAVGFESDPGKARFADTYWDTDESGITDLSQGVGNIPNDPGVTGLTTSQLQSGLPPGFDPAVWTENPNINGGLPYLIANPPLS